MKEMWRQFRKGAIVVSCGMLALGILMALWPDISALTVCIVFGIFCIVAGVYAMVRYFKLGVAGIFFRSDLSFGICSILGGAAVAPSLWGCGIPADCSRFLHDYRKCSGYTGFCRDAPASFWKLGCYADPGNLKYSICTAATDKSFPGSLCFNDFCRSFIDN